MASKRAFEDLGLTNEERKMAKKICQQHKFIGSSSQPTDHQIQALKAFTFGIGIINLLIINGRYDELLIILSLLSVKELVNVAAAAHSDFVDMFWTPRNSKMMRDFVHHFYLKTYFHDKPSYKHLTTLTTGSQILREYRFAQITFFTSSFLKAKKKKIIHIYVY
jgi:hypothetical protein